MVFCIRNFSISICKGKVLESELLQSSSLVCYIFRLYNDKYKLLYNLKIEQVLELITVETKVETILGQYRQVIFPI